MAMVEDGSFMQAAGLPGSGESKLWARFFLEAEHDVEASATAGRPIYRDVEFIEIRVPGDKDEIRVRPVRESDKQQFPRQYAAFKQGMEAPIIGTHLDKIPFITKAQVAELNAIGVKTAEQLRDMSDSNATKIMGANGLRKRVSDFLAAAEGAAPALKLQSELEKRDNEIEALKNLLDEQRKRMDEISKRGK